MRASVDSPVVGARLSVWQAAVVFRIAAAVFSCYLILHYHHAYARPALGLAVGAAIVAWTAASATIMLAGRAHRASFVIVDVGVVAGLTLLTIPVQTGEQLQHIATLTSVWGAAPCLSAGIVFGWRGGLIAGFIQGIVTVVVRDGYGANTVTNVVLLLLAGSVTGYVSELLVRAEFDLERASAARAALAERERLARSIHDGVLQVLALVQRRGNELGGDAAELGRLAGEQEVALRSMVTSAAVAGQAARDARVQLELAARLVMNRSPDVTVSVPAEPVLVDAARGEELLAATAAALDNVGKHAGSGAHAWILLEDLGDEVVLTVRDDGVGMPVGRLGEAAAAGRLGLRSSVRGRLDAIGGQTIITSAPDAGTEVELRMPRQLGRRR